nr:type IV toxin-antitoxin system AbiEi family antitoxin domain-containing protein [Rhizobium sp. BK538]
MLCVYAYRRWVENAKLRTCPVVWTHAVGGRSALELQGLPERAFCELLDLLPSKETFHEADVLMESVRTLSPKRVQEVLEACRGVKVKRLFLWFAAFAHPWFGRLDLKRLDLGRGKRQIAVGGRLDSKYQITVPETLDAGV